MSVRRKDVLIDGFFLSIFLLIFVSFTWGKWIHPIVDFGREVYIPWAIDQGAVLYKDLAFLFGAFPPYWNALLFKIFGASLQTIHVVDVLVVFLCAALIYRFFYCTMNRLTAFMVTLSFLVLFVMDFYYYESNMAYLSPFTHSYLYAFFFVLAAVNIWQSFLMRQSGALIFFLGICAGGVVVSRLEIAAAFFVALLIGFSFYVKRSKQGARQTLYDAGCFIGGILIPIALFWAYFLMHLPPVPAFLSIIGYNPQWRQVGDLYFYKFLGGWNNWELNVLWMIRNLLVYAALYASFHLMLIARLSFSKKEWLKGVFSFAIFCMVYGGVAFYISDIYARGVFRGAIPVVAALIGISLFNICQNKERACRDSHLSIVVLAVFAFLLMFKVPLQLTLQDYALIYGMFGVLMFVAGCVYYLPERYQQYPGGRNWVALLVCALLVLVMVRVGIVSWGGLSSKKTLVGRGENVLWTFDSPAPFGSGGSVKSFLDWSREHFAPEDTFVVLPEGIMLNFLTGHRITGRHVTYMPAEVTTFGEASMLQELKMSPPDYVVVVVKQTNAYGGLNLGVNYLNDVYRWVKDNYTVVWRSGSKKKDSFLMSVYQKKERKR